MKFTITLITCLVCGFMLNANNIEVSNISLENQNDIDNWVHVEFDINWENSWRVSSGPSNWDAAWVFVKYRINNGSWIHASLDQSNTVAPSGSIVQVTSDGIGAMIHRSVDGIGAFALQDVQLQWNYGGISPDDIIDIKVFAIEMVYVPQGQFYLGGSSGDEIDKFYAPPSTSSSYLVTSENAITIANSTGNLYYASISSGGDQIGPVPDAFPKGFNAFYCMKYEVTQAQYIGFSNTLTPSQKEGRDPTDEDNKNSDDEFIRNSISWEEGTSSPATTQHPDVPMNYVNHGDVNAYLDWSGLRPMTELEFEKSCRGPIVPKPNEYAWGNANIASEPYVVFSSGFPSEFINNPAESTGNANYLDTNGTTSGPKRVGIMAASAVNKSREETGGTYYGIMEMSGNVYERAVNVGTPRGRLFNGVHGNGIIGSTGNGTVVNWPLSSTGEGYGYRGGSYTNQTTFIRVSDRNDASNTFSGTNGRIGFRGVRTAE
ncbi:MAG: formylglycine-generating enzyme family protein [Bacteroidia bacterium]|nr:formylglycine-generating enzyme family protein [Bacteroidia bacterium]